MENNQTGAPKAIYLLLAVVIAVGIWFYVDTFGDNGAAYPAQQEVSDIPIEYTGEAALAEQGLMLLKDGTTDSVDLTFQGPRMLVSQLDRSKIRITASLSDIKTAGVQNVNYSYAFLDEYGKASFPVRQKFAQAVIFSRSVETATVNISELYRKEIDVRCELIGRVAAGYSAGQLQLSPSSVEIQGLESDIASVSYAKISLNLGDGAEESVSQVLTCQFYNDADELIEPEHFTPMTEQIQVTLPVYVTKELTLEIDFTDASGARMRNVSYEIDPPTVTVTGEASRLKNTTSITLGGFNLMNLVNAGVTTQPTYHSYAVIVPDGCENESGISRATLEIAFKDMFYGTVTTTRFSTSGTNLPEGKSVEILTESLDVSIFGPHDAVEAMTGVNLLVTPDLSDYTAASGVYTVPAQVSLRSGFDVGILGTYQIRVNITDVSGGENGSGGNEPDTVTAIPADAVQNPAPDDITDITENVTTDTLNMIISADPEAVTADMARMVTTAVSEPVTGNPGEIMPTDVWHTITGNPVEIMPTDVWHTVTADTMEISVTERSGR